MHEFSGLITWTFVTVNASRTLAYLPQIFAALRCSDGARAISALTWGYFALAHFTGAIYSLGVVHDTSLAAVFSGNCLACVALLGIVGWKRFALASASRARVRHSAIATSN